MSNKINVETPTERWEREAVEQKLCTSCRFCAWEPDSDLFCVHAEAYVKVSPYGASFGAMRREGLCEVPTKQLWEPRNVSES